MSAPSYYLRLDRERDLVVIECEQLDGEHTAANYSDAELLAQYLIFGRVVALWPPSPVVVDDTATD